MRPFSIYADSTCDLSTELRKAHNIKYMQMYVLIDEVQYPASLDWEQFTLPELYGWMRDGKNVKTAQVDTEQFYAKFEAELKEGNDILFIACSSALSGTYNLSLLVSKELMAKYPGSKIVCIDSLNASLGQGLITLKAAELRDEGKSIDEVAEIITAERLKFNQIATVGKLKYLKNAGRVKAAKAFFGDLFGIKPLIMSDKIGQNFAYTKAKGRMGSMKLIVEETAKKIVDPDKQTVFVCHSDCLEDANKLKEMLLEAIPNIKNIEFAGFGPILGASCGPDTLAVYFYGKEVTELGNE